MKLNKDNGITIIVLIITIIIMLLLIGGAIQYGKDAVDTAKLEDVKTDMISIKTKAKIEAEQYNFKDIESLTGTPLDEDPQQGIQQSNYTIPIQLKQVFEAELDISKLYIWTQQDLNNKGLNTIKVNQSSFYIVYYNLQDTTSCEVYYSKGVENKYSLEELQEL
ncbi:MAG: hypothetical protein Q4G09_05445 [Clostridia bacterium]|nr:hypothetical protein [Clostridia bacterium]